MMKMTLLFVPMMITGSCLVTEVSGQTYFRITEDTARIVNGELIIGNQTKNVNGVLINTGEGITRFQKLEIVDLGDSAIALAGQDTLHLDSFRPGRYYVLSGDIPILPNHVYHPLAFQAPLDSGKMYKIEALIYLRTDSNFNHTALLRARYSGTTVDNVYSECSDTTNVLGDYGLFYSKLIRSLATKDTFRLSFETGINDTSGKMMLDSLSYLYVEELYPNLYSAAYTVDTPGMPPPPPLLADEFYVLDSAIFNFTPYAQAIPGYTNVAGDPSKEVISATAANGININTISTSGWSPHPDSGSASLSAGVRYPSPADPFYYENFDSASIVTGFHNYGSQYQEGAYNLELSGLDVDKRYQIRVTGSTSGADAPGDAFSTRTTYYLSDGQHHAMNTAYSTSREIIFDTVKPSSEGKVALSVTGQVSSYSGDDGVISALKIYEITGDSLSSDRKTAIHKHYYATDTIWDGYVNRVCAISRPYNYDPTKHYPIFLFLDGQESAAYDSTSWDPEIAVMDGVGINLQQARGNLYGIDANGDTCGFITIIPQNLLNPSREWSLRPDEINTLLTNFKQKYSSVYQFDDDLFMGGISSGAGALLNYLVQDPDKVTAAYIASPASSPYSAFPTDVALGEWAQQLPVHGTKLWIMIRNDGTYTESVKLYDSAFKYAPGQVFYTKWYRSHSGFAWEWQMDRSFQIPMDQTPYDFFFNPTRKRKMSAWCFQAVPPDGFRAINGHFFTNVARDTDLVTGYSFSSIATNKWAGTYASVPAHLPAFNSLRLYPYWVSSYVYGAGREAVQYKAVTYESGGDNIQLGGLIPNHPYAIFWAGYGNPLSVTGDIAVMHWGSDSTVLNESTLYPAAAEPIRMDGTSDAEGHINLGFYPGVNGSDSAYLSYLMIVDQASEAEEARISEEYDQKIYFAKKE